MRPGAERGRRSLGQVAEQIACDLLEKSGLRLVARNWRAREGELDIVASAPDGTCVFCEVRSRTGEETGSPLETVNARKRAQIIRVARSFLAENPVSAPSYRFDVVGVTFFADGRDPLVIHVPRAFEVGD